MFDFQEIVSPNLGDKIFDIFNLTFAENFILVIKISKAFLN